MLVRRWCAWAGGQALRRDTRKELRLTLAGVGGGGVGWDVWRERLDAPQIRPGAGGLHSLEGVHAAPGAREHGQGEGPAFTVYAIRSKN